MPIGLMMHVRSTVYSELASLLFYSSFTSTKEAPNIVILLLI